MKLFKKDVVRMVSVDTGLTLKKSKGVVDVVLDVIERSLLCGDSIDLVGFGVFETRAKRGGLKRNPRNSDKVFKRPSRRPHFRYSERLKKIIEKSK